MYDRAWNEYVLTKIPTHVCSVPRSRNFTDGVIHQPRVPPCSFGMNPRKMSGVAEVGEMLGVVAREDTSGRGLRWVRNCTQYRVSSKIQCSNTAYIIRNR